MRADGYRSRLVLFEREGWLRHLEAAVVLLLNRRYMITTRWFYRQAFECPVQPPAFRERIEFLVRLRPAGEEEIAATAESLTADLLAFVRARGVAVESADLIV